MNKYKPLPPIDFLLENYNYNPDTGLIFRKPRPLSDFGILKRGKTWLDKTRWMKWNDMARKKPVLATNDSRGYARGCLHHYGKFYCHRVAWKMYHGVEPENQIDHISGDRSFNGIKNLRDVSNRENCRNLTLQPKNQTGRIGVWFDEKQEKYLAQIGVDGKTHYLGRFDSFDNACNARNSAEIAHGFHKNHGKIRNGDQSYGA